MREQSGGTMRRGAVVGGGSMVVWTGLLETLQICIRMLEITLIPYLVAELAQVDLRANKGKPKLLGLYYLSNLIEMTENVMINLSDIIQTIICSSSVDFVG